MYDFLLVCHYNYDHILYHFRDKARYWSKIAIFHTPLHITTPLGKEVANIFVLFSSQLSQMVRLIEILIKFLEAVP